MKKYIIISLIIATITYIISMTIGYQVTQDKMEWNVQDSAIIKVK